MLMILREQKLIALKSTGVVQATLAAEMMHTGKWMLVTRVGGSWFCCELLLEGRGMLMSLVMLAILNAAATDVLVADSLPLCPTLAA